MPKRPPRLYTGPPSYHGRWPHWGFPAVALRPGDITSRRLVDPARCPAALLRAAGALSIVTSVAALAAAGGEAWRFRLLLRGRTELLSGSVVRASDATVLAASWTAAAAALLTAIVFVTATVRCWRSATGQAGWQPTRTAAAVVTRLAIPGWNVWGAGQMLVETDALLVAAHRPGGEEIEPRARPSRLMFIWWAFWAVDSVLALLALVIAFGSTEQAMANAVEMHIAVDLCGAVVAALTAAVAVRWLRIPEAAPSSYAGWRVAAPDPTSDRRRRASASRTASAETADARQTPPTVESADESDGGPAEMTVVTDRQAGSEMWTGAGTPAGRDTNQETVPASGEPKSDDSDEDAGPASTTVTSTP